MVRLSRVLIPQGGFDPTHKPVVIDPFDPIVQQAYNEVRAQLPDIDVIKLEQACPAGVEAFVSNVDYLEGPEGKKRVLHLCLNNIKERFKKIFGQVFDMTNPAHNQKMKEAIKAELVHRVLPHEGVHVEQEEEGMGQFGPSPELPAQRAEHPEKVKTELEKIILKKAVDELDSMADALEIQGCYKEAADLDIISNTIDKYADMYGMGRSLEDTARKLFEELKKVKDIPNKLSQAWATVNKSLENYYGRNIQLIVKAKNMIRDWAAKEQIALPAVHTAAEKDIKRKFDIAPISCFLVIDPKDDEGYIRYTDKDIPDKFKKYKCTLIEFPKLRQAFQFSCGASAVQMILEFYGYDENEKDIMKSLDTKESGTTIDPVVRYFKNKGFKVEDGEGTIDDIKKWIDKCVPAILTIQAWGDDNKKSYKGYKDGHFVVAVGYTDEHIIFSDPSSVYDAYLTYDELDKRWHDIDEDSSDKIEHYMVVPYGKDPVYEPYRVMPLE